MQLPYLFSVPSFLPLFQIEFFQSILGGETSPIYYPEPISILESTRYQLPCSPISWPCPCFFSCDSRKRGNQCDSPCYLYSCQCSRCLQRKLKTCTTLPSLPDLPAKW